MLTIMTLAWKNVRFLTLHGGDDDYNQIMDGPSNGKTSKRVTTSSQQHMYPRVVHFASRAIQKNFIAANGHYGDLPSSVDVSVVKKVAGSITTADMRIFSNVAMADGDSTADSNHRPETQDQHENYGIPTSTATNTTTHDEKNQPGGDDDDCTFTEDDWQTRFHPVCNSLHELSLQWETNGNVYDMHNGLSLLSDYGTWRSAWLLEDVASSLSVLKMLHLARSYNQATFQSHQRDAIFMESLQASPYVVKEFGFCGQSVVVDYARRDGLFIRNKVRQGRIAWKRRLVLARDLALGLEHIHARSIAHADIKLVNAILVAGGRTIQWNDFNFGAFLIKRDDKGNGHGGEPCGVPARSSNGVWRCPEEIFRDKQEYARSKGALSNDHTKHNATTTPGKPRDIRQQHAERPIMITAYDKCDMFMFGNVMVELMTGQEPWFYDRQRDPSLTENDIGRLKYQGVKPTLSATTTSPGLVDVASKAKNIRNEDPQRHGVLAALLESMEWCFARDPSDRPTARQLALALNSSLELVLSTEQGIADATIDEKIKQLFRSST